MMKNLKYLLVILLILIPVGLVVGLWMMGFDIELNLESVVGATLVLLCLRAGLANPPQN